jgi:catechol 2,3-dioxygenase-like lactoylglutathione lyase family enzyme
MRLNQITVGCTDYAASVAFYRALGLTQIVDAPPRYARFETPTGETFSIHKVDAITGDSTVVYFEIETLDQKVAALKAAGIRFERGPQDESWGWREARLRDPAGNPLCLFLAGDNRRFPPWRIDHQTAAKENIERPRVNSSM